MASILIDCEHAGIVNGLSGLKYLLPEDHLYLFYSDASSSIRAGVVRTIEESGCSFSAIRLVNRIQDVMEFYIATQAGEIFGKNPEEQVVIVSSGQDLQALLDFWKMRREEESGKMRYILTCSGDIEEGLLKLTEPFGEQRRKRIIEDRQMLKIGEEALRIRHLPKRDLR